MVELPYTWAAKPHVPPSLNPFSLFPPLLGGFSLAKKDEAPAARGLHHYLRNFL